MAMKDTVGCRALAILALLVSGLVFAGEGRWSSAGPYGGRIDSAVVSAADPNVIYAAAHRSVYRSSDGGQTWSLRSAGLNTVVAGEIVLAAHPDLAGRLTLAGARGVFLSSDGGRNWRRSDAGLPVGSSSFRTVDIAYAPASPTRLYLATAADGLYRSLDGGQSWTSVGGSSLPARLDRIAVDPANADLVLAWSVERNTGDFPASLYRSSNGGASFTAVTGPWDQGGPIRQPLELLAFNPNSSGTVFLAGAFGNYRSLSSGLDFAVLPVLPVAAVQRLQSLAADPASPGRVIFGTSHGVLLSVDNGLSFQARNSGLSVAGSDPASIGPVLIDPLNGNRWLAFSLSGEVYGSVNAGFAWTTVSTGLRGTSIGALAVHPGRPQRVFAGIRNLRTEATSPALLQSDDNGLNWFRFNQGLLLDSVEALAVDPVTVTSPASTVIYAGGADYAPLGQPLSNYRGGVFRSTDGGLSWAAVDTLVPMPLAGAAATGMVRSIAVDGSSASGGFSQRLYFAARGLVSCAGPTATLVVARIWRSTNAAASWSPRDGLPPGACSPRVHWASPVEIVIDPGDPQRLYVGTWIEGYCLDCGDPLPTIVGGVWRSTDGGQTWSAASNGLPLMSGSGGPLDVLALASAPGQPGVLYVALLDPTIEGAPGRLFKSTDGGDNWNAAESGLAGQVVRSLRVDPLQPSRVYAGVSGNELSPGGVFLSNDGGTTWNSISIDLPVDSAGELALGQPGTGAPTLHAGTDEGVWSLTRVPDGDIDGPPDVIEDLAPNAGDGNNDGIPDRLQADVASFEIPLGLLPVEGTAKQGTLSNTELFLGEGGGNCQQVHDVAAIDPALLPVDPGYRPDAGLVRFEFVDCSVLQAKLTFHNESFGPDWQFRRFGPTTADNVLTLDWFSPVPTAVSRTGNTWFLTVVDNGPGDLRREPGRILFIGGPAREVSLFADGFE